MNRESVNYSLPHHSWHRWTSRINECLLFHTPRCQPGSWPSARPFVLLDRLLYTHEMRHLNLRFNYLLTPSAGSSTAVGSSFVGAFTIPICDYSKRKYKTRIAIFSLVDMKPLTQEPFIWHLCAQNRPMELVTSSHPPIPNTCIIVCSSFRRHCKTEWRTTFSQLTLPLAAPIMRPDSLPRLWRYINPLLTKLL